MKILIVDDDTVNRTILSRLLQREGHEVYFAENGEEGVAYFQLHRPDLVLMDVRMPRMDGYTAARLIKSLTQDQFIPIIFVTALADDESLARCVDSGGDDFLTKPFNRIILRAKIDALDRIRQLHATLREQNRQLEAHREVMRREMAFGNHLLTTIAGAGNLNDAPCLTYHTQPMSMFNGDLLVVSYTPSGCLDILLGDFTGHGLSAAVGALPLSETFYDTVRRGYALADIAEAINDKLRALLPVGTFCAACLIEIDPRRQNLSVWNGGLPDLLLIDGNNNLLRRVTSRHLPLGVREFSSRERKLEMIQFQSDYRMLVYSDGLIEAANPQGIFFGEERLLEQIKPGAPSCSVFESLLDSLDKFRSGAPRNDDISLLEIDCGQPICLNDLRPTLTSAGKQLGPSTWSVHFDFGADSLRQVDPLPTLIQVLMQLQAPTGHRDRIYTILGELFTNALEHGLLGLDTRLKETAEGFFSFYQLRETRLAELSTGWISVDLTHTPVGQGGHLVIVIRDSGPGFRLSEIHSSLEGNQGKGSRGIALVRSLCSEVTFSDPGNAVKAIYHWSQ
ncbi:MAG: SpoIIE family protein phosphatase [Magnetococcus sp. WYHC-3]